MFNMCDSCNNICVCYIITPYHVLPEWYYILFYGMIKCICNGMLCI